MLLPFLKADHTATAVLSGATATSGLNDWTPVSDAVAEALNVALAKLGEVLRTANLTSLPSDHTAVPRPIGSMPTFGACALVEPKVWMPPHVPFTALRAVRTPCVEPSKPYCQPAIASPPAEIATSIGGWKCGAVPRSAVNVVGGSNASLRLSRDVISTLHDPGEQKPRDQPIAAAPFAFIEIAGLSVNWPVTVVDSGAVAPKLAAPGALLAMRTAFETSLSSFQTARKSPWPSTAIAGPLTKSLAGVLVSCWDALQEPPGCRTA